MTRLLCALTACLLTACGDKDPEDEEGDGGVADGGAADGGEADGGAACGSTYGFVYGTVLDAEGSEPVPGAQVRGWAEGGALEAVGELDGRGGYELNVEGGHTWTVSAWSGARYSDAIPVEVEACEEYLLDLPLIHEDTADAPNLYLYPAADTPTTVRLRLRPGQRVVASDPAYRGAWRGIAHPDGTFSVGDQRAPFLFYEASLLPGQVRAMQWDEGWCLDPALTPAQAAEAMGEVLAAYGFDARERADFVEAWQVWLPPAREGYAVHPQLALDQAVGVDLSPALPLHRLWLVVAEGAGCVPGREPIVEPFDRDGPHAVEWGVVLQDLVK